MEQLFTARTSLLIGEAGMEILQNARVAVIGLGGVGGACAEALGRAGIGTLILMDHDTVDPTNLNRQCFATINTVGMPKTQAAEQRLLACGAAANLVLLPYYYDEASKDRLFSQQPDIIIDAIDTVTSKLHLAKEAQERGLPVLCCLGTGNRLDPTAFRLGRIEDTSGCGCPLARVMRRECKKRGIEGLTVVYSIEQPRTVIAEVANGRHSPASISFCPPAAGYAAASWAVRRLLNE